MAKVRLYIILLLALVSFQSWGQYPPSYCASNGLVFQERDFAIPDSDTIVQLVDSGRCAGGRMVGLWISRYVGNGKLFSKTMMGDSVSYWSIHYHPNGMVESLDSVIERGVKEISQVYDRYGRLLGSTIIDTGSIRYMNYYSNGQVSSVYQRSYPFTPDERYVRRMYSQNGTLFDETEYVDGRKDGSSKRYRPDETLLYECTYQYGQLEGQYKKYDETGALLEVLLYSKGIKLW